MLCAECRLFYKKYGIDRVIENRPETPPELRKIREQARAEQEEATLEEEHSEMEHNYSITNADENSRPGSEIGIAPKLPTTTPPSGSNDTENQSHDENKTEIKQESVIKTEQKSETVIKEESDDTKRKIQNEHNAEDEPQNKKHKHEIKQEADKIQMVSISYSDYIQFTTLLWP